MSNMRYVIALYAYVLSFSALALPSEIISAPSVMHHAPLSRLLLALSVVVLIIFLLSFIIKRLNVVNFSSSKGFESLASMTLGPKERIMLIKAGRRHLLIGIGASSVNTLYDFGEDLPEGFDVEHKPSFASLLKTAVRKSSYES